MASAADTQFVLDNIEDDYAENMTLVDITARLDAGARKERVVAVYWRKRATQTMLLVNTSEAGSSRGMDSVYPRMNALAVDWEARADLLENPPEDKTTARLATFPIRRV